MGSAFGRHGTEVISSALREISAPIFAAVWSNTRRGEELFVHLAAAPKRALLRRQIAAALLALGVDKFRVRFHNAAQLHAPRSLEKLVARFAGEEVVYDPTGAVGRAKALVAAGHAVRASLAEKLFGIYYAPRLRTFYVALKAKSLAVGDKFKVADLAGIERAVTCAMQSAFAPQLDECPAVRVGFGLPGTNLVAVDRQSVVHWGTRLGSTLRRFWKPVTLAALFGFGLAGTAAARDPAVSETNLKITGTAGQVDDNGAWEVNGGLTAPLGKFTGVQLEAGVGQVDGDTILGAAAHVFWRDPDKWLFGLYAAYAQEDDFDQEVTRIAAEGELYMNQISLIAAAGYQFGEIPAAFGGGNVDGAFGRIDLKWYLTDNFALTAGGEFLEDNNSGHLVAEFQPGYASLPGLAFNLKGVVGDDDYDSVMGGLTYYFGSPASLKDRHRKQDPESALFGLFQAVQAERSKLEAIYGP